MPCTAEKKDAPDRLRESLADWERAAAQAFGDGYREAAAGLASVPADAASLQALIDLFTFEKALYELRYELDNRPDWIHIPVRGLLALLDVTKPGESSV